MSTSVLFDYPCKGDDERAVPTDLAWCRSENLLACALDSGRIAIYQDEVRSCNEGQFALEGAVRWKTTGGARLYVRYVVEIFFGHA